MQLPLSFQIQNHGRQLLRQTLDKYYAVGESSDAVTLAWNFFMAEVKYLLELCDQSSLCLTVKEGVTNYLSIRSSSVVASTTSRTFPRRGGS